MDVHIIEDFMAQTRICILGIMDNLNISVTNELIRCIEQKYGIRYWCYELFGVHANKCDGADVTAILTNPDFGFSYYYKSESKQILGDITFYKTIFAGTSTLTYNYACIEALRERNCMTILLMAEDVRQKNEIALYGYAPIRNNLKRNYTTFSNIIANKTADLCDLVFDVTVKNARQIAEEILSSIEGILDELISESDGENEEFDELVTENE